MNNISRGFEEKHRSSKNKKAFIEAERLTLLRKIDKTSRVKPSINFYSHKLKALQYAESILEADSCLRLEFEPTIKRYLTQPFSFQIKINNCKTRYTPDVLVENTEGDFFFIEVKPMSVYQKEKNQIKFAQVKDFFEEELNVPFKVLTEKEIREGKLTQNLQQLYGFLDIAIDINTVQKIIAHLPEIISVKVLEQACAQEGKTAQYAWALIAQGYFDFDYEKLLTRITEISINYNRLGA